MYEGCQIGVAGEVPRQVHGRCRDTSRISYGSSFERTRHCDGTRSVCARGSHVQTTCVQSTRPELMCPELRHVASAVLRALLRALRCSECSVRSWLTQRNRVATLSYPRKGTQQWHFLLTREQRSFISNQAMSTALRSIGQDHSRSFLRLFSTESLFSTKAYAESRPTSG